MSTSTDWTCACRAVNAGAAVWCEACGIQRPDRPTQTGSAKVIDIHRAYIAPTYPAPPAPLSVAKAAMAEITRLLATMGQEIPVGTCAKHPEGCGRSKPALRGPA